MKIQILSDAELDLLDGFNFYNSQEQGLGEYFIDSLLSDIDSLLVYAGIHPLIFGFHRMLSQRFPYSIYYSIEQNVIRVWAVLDCRRNPVFTEERLEHTDNELK